jgi:hypothetical protein
MEPIKTVVSVGSVPTGRRGIPNITLQDAKFFGRPNFSGIEDQFKDSRRKFTVLIPNDVADQLRDMGYNVKTDIPTQEQLAEFPDREMISHLKVMVDDGSDVYVKIGESAPEKVSIPNYGVIDKTRITEMDMEIRGWEYNPEEKPGQFSARLVAIVANCEFNILAQKYGALG